MLCMVCDQQRMIYIDGDVVDIRRGMILVRNMVLGLISLGTGNPCEALKRGSIIAIGRVIEAPTRVGVELVGKTIFYLPHIYGEMICGFSEGDPSEAIEVTAPGFIGSRGLISFEASLALKYASRAGASPLVMGGGFLPHLALYTLQLSGVRGYTIERVFRGVDAINLNAENAVGRRYSSVYIAGLLSDAEKRVLETLSIAGGLKIYIHPLLKSERIYIPIGDRIYTRVLRYSTPSPRAFEIASRFVKIARGYSYVEASTDEEPPAMGDFIVISIQKT
ncbi:MAG: hypothetical protein QXE01_07495 [Sulfolobales archaeon]